MLIVEVFRMARATHPGEGRFASQAKKRLIATADPRSIGILSDQREPKELSSSLTGRPSPTSDTKAKKRLIATLPNSKIAATHSKRTYITNSNRNTKPSSAIAIFLPVSVANPAHALLADGMCPTLSAYTQLTPPERGCYIQLFADSGEFTLISRRSIWRVSLPAVALFACGCAV